MSGKIIAMRGLPASGKSTHAKEKLKEGGYCRLNKDDIRLSLYGQGFKWSKEKENLVNSIQLYAAKEALKTGLTPIIDDTNLIDKAVSRWSQFALENGAILIWENLTHVPIHECISRDYKRGIEGKAFVGRTAIEKMALDNGLVDIQGEISLFDLDGTLANSDHRMALIKEGSKKDWHTFHSLCFQDGIHQDVLEILYREKELGRTIVLITGRNAMYWPMTNMWLDEYLIPFSHIYMKPNGDFRKDWEWKEEVINKLSKSKIAFAIDDRMETCEMYRRNGINTVHYGEE